MTDLLLVVATMAVVLYATYFIRENDRDGNSRPDKTLFAMKEDKLPEVKKWGQFRPASPLPPPRPPRD